MNITVNHQKLVTAIRAVERIVAKNISLPILNTILLRVEKNSVVLQATNLEIGIRYTVGAKVEQEGTVAIPARVLSEFIASIREEKVTLSAVKNVLLVSSESYQTKILCLPPDEFPIIPTLHKAEEVVLPAKALHEALASVVDATSLLETRPELNGVYVKIDDGVVVCAATDSFRLSERTIAVTSTVRREFIVPRGTVLETLRLVAERTGDVTLAVSESQVTLKTPDFELISRLIDGRYPDYRKVIPERVVSSMIIKKDECERHVRTASIFSSSVSDVILHAVKAGLNIQAKNNDRGDISIQTPGVLNGDAFDLNLNYRYLLDGLKVIPTDSVAIHFTGVGSPVVLRAPERNDIVYVIMPLRT